MKKIFKQLIRLSCVALLVGCVALFVGCSISGGETNLGGDEPPHTHEFGSWELISEPSCEVEGYETRTCSCGEMEERHIPALGHSMETVWAGDTLEHWYACAREDCDYCGSEAPHRFNGSTCEICERELPPTEGIVYELSGDGTYAIVTAYTGQDRHVVIADVWQEKPVKVIGEYAFSEANSSELEIRSVFIPTSVVTISTHAFYSCKELATVNFSQDGNALKTIGAKAFFCCESLTDFKIPASVVAIETMAFDSCGNLVNVSLDDGSRLERIGPSCFRDCQSLTNILLPDTIVEVAASSFDGCENLQYSQNANGNYLGNASNSYLALIMVSDTSCSSYTVHADTKVIASHAFWGCANAVSISLPDGLTRIGDRAFGGCGALLELAIPSSVQNIGEGILVECANVRSLTLPFIGETEGDNAGIDYVLGDAGFLSLRNVVVMRGLALANQAFYGLQNLTSVTLPVNMVSIGTQAFFGCESLDNIVLPAGLTSIGSEAFLCCTSLTYMTIPAGVTVLQDSVFEGCSSLISVTANGATKIGKLAFDGCLNLTNFFVPDGVTEIGASAFYGCRSLTSIRIPNGVRYIGEMAFYGCEQLNSATFAVTTGWKAVSLGVTSEISSTYLANSATAAIILSKTYYEHELGWAYWAFERT